MANKLPLIVSFYLPVKDKQVLGQNQLIQQGIAFQLAEGYLTPEEGSAKLKTLQLSAIGRRSKEILDGLVSQRDNGSNPGVEKRIPLL